MRSLNAIATRHSSRVHRRRGRNYVMRHWVFLAAFLWLAGIAAPALAEDDRGSAQPLDRIIEGIRNSRSGSFYDAEGPFPGPDGRMHYRIKWMTPEGRVIWLDTDAHTGRVLGTDAGGRRSPFGGEEGRSRRMVPDREEFEHRDEERQRFERERPPFGGGDDDGFGAGRYDRGDFGGRIPQDRGRRGPH